MDEKEYGNVYAIPANYTDSGKLLSGMLEARNTVETGFLLLIVGYPELMWMSTAAIVKVIIMTVTLLPLGVLGLMGIGGDSLLQFAGHVAKFLTRRRKLHYRRIGYVYEKAAKPSGRGRVKKKSKRA